MNTNRLTEMPYAEKFKELWRIIGNSPMIVIRYTYKGEERKIYAKSEQFNITGSIKDRMALFILQQAYSGKAGINNQSPPVNRRLMVLSFFFFELPICITYFL